MLQTIIITVIAIMALIHSFTTNGTLQKVITTMLSISVLLIWVNLRLPSELPYYLQLAAAFLTLIYPFIEKGLPFIRRILIGGLGFVFSVNKLIEIQYYKQYNLIGILFIAFIALFVWEMRGNLRRTKEFGFLMVWIALSVLQLLHLFM